jgi:hypothetical protein
MAASIEKAHYVGAWEVVRHAGQYTTRTVLVDGQYRRSEKRQVKTAR